MSNAMVGSPMNTARAIGNVSVKPSGRLGDMIGTAQETERRLDHLLDELEGMAAKLYGPVPPDGNLSASLASLNPAKETKCHLDTLDDLSRCRMGQADRLRRILDHLSAAI